MSYGYSHQSVVRLAWAISGLVLVLVAAIVVPRLRLEIGALKGPVEEALTAFVEAPTTVERMGVRIGLRPTFYLEGLSIAGSGWEGAPRLAQVDHLELRVGLLPLLRRALRIKRLEATGVRAQIHRPKGRPGNWPAWRTFAYEVEELSGIDVREISVVVVDHELGERDLIVDRLKGGIASDEPLELDLRGSLDGLPLALSVEGPGLAVLTAEAVALPVSTRLELADLRLSLEGIAVRQGDEANLDLDLGLSGGSLQVLDELVDLEVPDLGVIELGGRLRREGGVIELSGLGGRLGETSMRGDLEMDLSGGRPSLEGRVALGRLDLSLWRPAPDLDPLAAPDGAGDERVAPGPGRESEQPLPLSALCAVDAELELTIERLVGLGVEVEDLDARIAVAACALDLPARLRVAAIPVTVTLRAAGAGEPPALSLAGETTELTVGRLRSIIDLPAGVDGRIGRVELSAGGSGARLEELLDGLEVRVEASDAEFVIDREDHEAPIALDLRSAALEAGSGRPLAISAEGDLFDVAFVLDAHTARFASLLAESSWPLALTARGAGAELTAEGDLRWTRETPVFDLDFAVAGERIADLGPWLGVSPGSDLPYRLEGHLLTGEGSRSLRLDRGTLGRTAMSGAFRWSDSPAIPLAAEIDFDTLDLTEIRPLFEEVTEIDVEQEDLGFDLPLLPNRVHFGDADLELTIARLHRVPVGLTGISAALKFRDGLLESSPFSLTYDSREYAGRMALDLRGEVPFFELAMAGRVGDLGRLLEEEEIVDGLRATAEELELSVLAEGATLRRLLETAVISGSLEEIRWRLDPLESGDETVVELDRLEVRGPRGQPITAEGSGRIGEEPLAVALDLGGGKADFGVGDTYPVHLTVDLAGATFGLEARVPLPLEPRGLDLRLTVAGERLDGWSALIGRDLPAVGPYRLAGRLDLGDQGYSLTDLDLRLGESDLTGSLSIGDPTGRPRLTANLAGELIRTADLIPDAPGAGEQGESVAGVEEPEPAEPTYPRLLDILDRLDGSVSLEVERILTADGAVRALSLDGTLEQGRLDARMRMTAPGGKTADLILAVEPSGEQLEARMTTRWERLPYGLLGELSPNRDQRGELSVDLDLRGRGSSLDELISSLEGHLDFTDYPESLDATILDLWGGGLLDTALPSLGLRKESRVNCTVGRFGVEEGVMTPELLVVDSTRSRVRGKGTIDLAAGTVNLRMKPRPKKFSLISLASPVRVVGPLDEPKIQLRTEGAATILLRIQLWVYVLWRDLIFNKRLPADGRDICLDPLPLQPR